MSFYSRHVLPRFIDLTMRNPEASRLRAESIPRARGEVLEIGFGSGLNLPYYGEAVSRITGVDPSAELRRMAAPRVAASSLPVNLLAQAADAPLPLADASMDTAVSTWTMCSIGDLPRALEEVRRVLRDEGRLIFVEHGQAPDSGVSRWQDRLTPWWKRAAGGCHLNRKIDALLEEAGFEIVELRSRYLPGPRTLTYTYQGLARARR
jgi:ubiquinone/menaquinone biosynthesis C-methylase UbiE